MIDVRVKSLKVLEDYTIDDFVKLINSNFDRYVGRKSRTSHEWGAWSRDMNIEIKKRMDESESDEYQVLLGLVFSYWISVSQLLDLLHKRKRGIIDSFMLTRRTKAKVDEAVAIRNHIRSLQDENN